MDLEHVAQLVDENTAAIVINNPSNPWCFFLNSSGSCFSKEHLLAILSLVETLGIAVIADEIYDNLVWDGTFFPLGKKWLIKASLSKNTAILTVGGLSKKYMVPGLV